MLVTLQGRPIVGQRHSGARVVVLGFIHVHRPLATVLVVTCPLSRVENNNKRVKIVLGLLGNIGVRIGVQNVGKNRFGPLSNHQNLFQLYLTVII